MPTSTTKNEVIVVLGHRDPASTAVHRLSPHGVHRVALAQTLSRDPCVRAVIFSGSSTTGGPSEAKQMKAMWSGGSELIVLDEKSRSTAENAGFCLALVREMVGVTKVTVVTCNWHFRTRFMFAPYKKYGLSVRYRFVHDGLREFLRHLLSEFSQLPIWFQVRHSAYELAGKSSNSNAPS